MVSPWARLSAVEILCQGMPLQLALVTLLQQDLKAISTALEHYGPCYLMSGTGKEAYQVWHETETPNFQTLPGTHCSKVLLGRVRLPRSS